MHTSFMGLVHNVALLLAMGLIYDIFLVHRWTGNKIIQKVYIGFFLGLIGMAVMLSPWVFSPGVIFDTRSVLLGISGLFFGAIPAGVTMALTAGLRLYLGGDGVCTGVAVILSSGVIGITWRHFHRQSLAEISWRELYLFGCVVHIVMLLLMLTLPWAMAISVLKKIGLPVLLIFPFGTALLGALMANRLQRQEAKETLYRSHRRLQETLSSLEDSQKMLQLVIETIPVRVFWKDKDSRFMGCNTLFARDAGLRKPEELQGKNDFDMVWREQAELYRADDRQIMESGRPKMDIIEPQSTPTGETIWLDTSKVPLRMPTGEVFGILGVYADITERKRAEEELQESERRFRSLFENMLNGFAYCQMLFEDDHPQDFLYLDVKRAFETLTGLKDVIGKKVSEVIPGLRQSDPELFEIYGRVSFTRKPERFEAYVTALKMWFSISVYSPAQGYFVAVFDVITEQKRAEEELRLKEKLLDSASDSIFLHDLGGRVLYVNEAAYIDRGYMKEELLGGTISQLITPEDTRYRDSIMMELMASGEITFESEHLRKDGSVLPVEIHARVLEVEGRELILSVARDITERKKTEAEIIFQREELRGLAARLAEIEEAERQRLARELHDDVCQNLAMLSLNLEILKLKAPQEALENLLSRLEDVDKLAEQTNETIRDIMEGLRPMILDHYGLEGGLRQLVSKFIQQTDIAADFLGEELERLDPAVEMALFRINQEALANIAKHSKASQIRILFEKKNDVIRMTITDNGIGFTIDKRARPAEGKNWGLMIMTERARAVGGTCHIDSQPGQGTRVMVEVPL